MSAASACIAAARRRWSRPNCAYACLATRRSRPPPNHSRHCRRNRRTMSDPLAAALAGWRERADAALARALPDPHAPHASPQKLHAAMRHAVLLGGKRMRPLLLHAAGQLFGVDDAVLDAPATAVELIHAYSLVHDDLPAMD